MIRNLPQDRLGFVPCKGGCDFVTPISLQKPGLLRICMNMEIGVNGGYETSQGYEAYDGRAAPSDATYTVLPANITGTVVAGNTVTGATSAATGTVIDTESAAVIITQLVGTFVSGENLTVSAVVQAAMTADPVTKGASTPALNAKYLNLAADVYRALILAVPGEGTIRGICRLSGVLYAWRNAVGGATMAIYKSTISGWSLVPLGREVAFTSGGLKLSTGTVTLTGGASGSVDGITVNSVQIMSGAVVYRTSLSFTAADVAANINAFTSVPDYTASASGAVITITAVTGGAGSVGFVVTPASTTITTSSANMDGGAGIAIAEGDTITGAASAATAVITRVVLTSGSWTNDTAAGYLVFASQTGTFQSENLNIGATLNVATIAGNSAAITLSPSGRVKHFIYNFGGQAGTKRVYGCDGINLGFEFDGTVYVRIRTGMTTDTPTNVICHKSHLFFSFASSVQHSGTGYPYVWSPIFGAAEIAVGDTITGFSIEMGSEAVSALGILSRNTVHVLYGNDSVDWNLVRYRDEIGAYENSIQNIGSTCMVDDTGIVSLRAVNVFGNFAGEAISQLIKPFIQTRKATVTDSCIARGKNQYRVFFGDKQAAYMTFSNGNILGIMTQTLVHKVEVIHSVESSTGNEEIFFGSDDGYCYQMEKGTSFNGSAIESLAMFQYYNCGVPRTNKRFKGASIEASGTGYTEFSIGYEIGYGSSDFAQPGAYENTAAANFNEARWDTFDWEDFYWDSEYAKPFNVKLTGCAENIGMIFYKSSDEHQPTKISGIMLRYQMGRALR